MAIPKPVKWFEANATGELVETVYESRGALARAKGVSRQRVGQWLAGGYRGDADIGTNPNGRPPMKREKDATE